MFSPQSIDGSGKAVLQGPFQTPCLQSRPEVNSIGSTVARHWHDLVSKVELNYNSPGFYKETISNQRHYG